MKVYYLTAEYGTGRHRTITSVFEKDLITFDENVLSSHGIYDLDELIENQTICLDLLRTEGKVDIYGECKYHIEIENEEPVLYEKDGWMEDLNL